jgi:hypothetical protein
MFRNFMFSNRLSGSDAPFPPLVWAVAAHPLQAASATTARRNTKRLVIF